MLQVMLLGKNLYKSQRFLISAFSVAGIIITLTILKQDFEFKAMLVRNPTLQNAIILLERFFALLMFLCGIGILLVGIKKRL
jgi:hypothetical protein